ncbi:MAG: TIGR01212 family radical SAM protein [Lachnospiraceae bacterium]|nr:TIGR01212 family radical SAM protein [Lachnospiraceae bacterium]
MTDVDWLGKPYYSLDAYFKHTYGEKCYKLAVDAGFTCPNRDGNLDTRGCVFCSAGGSGDFADKYNINRQIETGLARFDKTVGKRFVIYFQAYTNTYGNIDYLRSIYTEALSHEQIVGISIATRPDCLGDEVIALLEELKNRFLDKFIWIELGLQTIHERTAEYIRRKYPLSVYETAVQRLNKIDIPFITHIILGLPNETEEMMLDTVKYVSNLSVEYLDKSAAKDPIISNIDGCRTDSKSNTKDEKYNYMCGIKLQLLHVLSGTDLARDYAEGSFHVLEQEEYIDLVIKCLQNIDERIVIHRVTGDGPKKILIAPKWSGNKKAVLNALHKRMKELGARQGTA